MLYDMSAAPLPGKQRLFSPGQLVCTAGVADLIEHGLDVLPYLRRHLQGDWGDLNDEDKAENELSLQEGFRLLSAYKLPDGEKLWVLTEADRSVTTCLLPREY